MPDTEVRSHNMEVFMRHEICVRVILRGDDCEIWFPSFKPQGVQSFYKVPIKELPEDVYTDISKLMCLPKPPPTTSIDPVGSRISEDTVWLSIERDWKWLQRRKAKSSKRARKSSTS